MLNDAFRIGEEILLHTVDFKIVPKLWSEFKIGPEIMENLVWEEYKFLNEDGTNFSDDLVNLPNDSGGIYSFIIKNPVTTQVLFPVKNTKNANRFKSSLTRFP